MAKNGTLASAVVPPPRERVRAILLDHPGIKPSQVTTVMHDKYHVGVDYRTVKKVMDEMGKLPAAPGRPPKTETKADGASEIPLSLVHQALDIVHQLGGIVPARDLADQITTMGGLTTFLKCVQFIEEVQAKATV